MTRPTEQSCSNCRLWSKNDPDTEKMVGVRPDYRKCSAKNFAKPHEHIEYRSPTDWCSVWRSRE